jgi:hypothetical protein
MYLVQDGRAGVWVERDGEPDKLATVRSGEFFGERELMRGGARTATVRAEGEVRLLRLSASAFQSLMEEPGFAARVHERLALHDARDREAPLADCIRLELALLEGDTPRRGLVPFYTLGRRCSMYVRCRVVLRLTSASPSPTLLSARGPLEGSGRDSAGYRLDHPAVIRHQPIRLTGSRDSRSPANTS